MSYVYYNQFTQHNIVSIAMIVVVGIRIHYWKNKSKNHVILSLCFPSD